MEVLGEVEEPLPPEMLNHFLFQVTAVFDWFPGRTPQNPLQPCPQGGAHLSPSSRVLVVGGGTGASLLHLGAQLRGTGVQVPCRGAGAG